MKKGRARHGLFLFLRTQVTMNRVIFVEEVSALAYLLVGVLIGLGIGMFIGRYVLDSEEEVAGTLKLKKDETDGDVYLFLELATLPEELLKMDHVRFDIAAEARK